MEGIVVTGTTISQIKRIYVQHQNNGKCKQERASNKLFLLFNGYNEKL
jgi:hypothetical protein